MLAREVAKEMAMIEESNAKLEKINWNLVRLASELKQKGQRSTSDLPLEEWLLAIIWRCARHRVANFPLEVREVALTSAFETIFCMVHANLENFLVGIPRAALGTNNLIVRLRIRWSHYRHIARSADDCLVRIFHGPSDSLDRAD